MQYNQMDRGQLLELARNSIQQQLKTGRLSELHLADYPTYFSLERASFVTLKIQGRLRGCMGSLQSSRPLAEDVAHNAYLAAFRDPRFPEVAENELDMIEISISVLGPQEPIEFNNEDDLLQKLRPGLDGLVLKLGEKRATFLPAVWESLSQPVEFLRKLKAKAGLSEDYWSQDLVITRYTTESFGTVALMSD